MRWIGLLLAALCCAGSARAYEISVPNYGSSISGVPFAIAMEKGFFKAEGAGVTAIRATAGGSADVRNMLAGELPFVESSLSGILAAVRHGADLKLIGELSHTNAQFVWVVRQDSPLHAPADLKGRKLSFTTPQSTSQGLDALLMSKFGLPPGSVPLVATGPYGAAITALENGGVDAAILAEPVYSLNKDRLRPIAWVRDLFPPINNVVAVTSGKVAREQPEELRAILRAHRRAVMFITEHRDEAAAVAAKVYKLDVGVVRDVIDGLLDHTGAAGVPFWSLGDFNPAGIDAMVSAMRAMGMPEADIPWRGLVDQSFLPDDLRRDIGK
jgi:NitT/TauT family transport system substrate-binding protein